MIDRRDLLKLGIGSLLLSRALPGEARAAAPPRAGRPRYFVQMFLYGGMDAVFTTDPRTRAEVEPGIDVPYARGEILEAGGWRLGPHLKPLARWMPKLAIVNGVVTGTANHNSGQVHTLSMKTHVPDGSPSLLDIIGAHRDGQPVGCISVGDVTEELFSPGGLGVPSGNEKAPDLFTALDRTEPGDLALLARIMRRQAGELGGRRRRALPDEWAVTASNIEQSAALFERLAEVPRFKEEKWAEEGWTQSIAVGLQRVLWILENDLARGVYFRPALVWDSHTFNVQNQANASGKFFPLLDRFFQELEKRRNPHGVVSDNTVLWLGSELGRFPRLNGFQGKDHFPEAPYVLRGPGINTNGGKGAVFGRTGRRMEALPVSLKTGRDTTVGGSLVTLDDLGATLLSLAGVAPRAYGYTGRILEFLEAA